MKKQAGFTLIELIMVIVILGILSAFALPRFADLSGNAEQASADGARAAVQSASAIGHAFALANNTATNTDVTLEGTTVRIIDGYPSATVTEGDICEAAGLDASFACTTTTARVASTTAAIATITGPGTCSFTYQEALGTTPPSISAVSGC